ncbi:MAG: T9SS type A sorting domain-containing protein [Bacteroidales bacterium]|nr:T9SS type A sorting domain-containing protein [Bacteroidales bacterium]
MNKVKILLKNLLLLIIICQSIAAVKAQEWLWIKTAGSSSYDFAHAIANDTNSNIFTTGFFEGTASFGSTQLVSSGQRDIFIAKYNPSGTVLWAKKAGGTSNEESLALAVDNEGNCFITGFFSGTATFGTGTNLTSTQAKDIFIAKYNGTNGNLIWAKKVGVNGDAEGAGIVVDNLGNCYISGYFRNTATFKSTNPTITLSSSNGSLDAFVAKYDASGVALWAKKSGGANLDRAYGIAIDSDENLITTGYYEGTGTFGSTQLTSNGDGDGFVAKYNNSGTLIWAESMGGLYSDWGIALTTDTNKTIYVTGRFEVAADFDTISLTSNGGHDIFVSKISSDGHFIYAKNFGGSYIDFPQSITTSNYFDAVYISGAYSISAQFDNKQVNSLTNSQDVFLARLDTNGFCEWVLDGGGAYDDVANDVCVDKYGNIFSAGYFYNSQVSFGNLAVSGYGEYDVFFGKICPLYLSVSKTDISCYGEGNGEIIVTPKEGASPFTYQWSPAVSTTDTASNLQAGTYLVTVSESLGCVATQSIEIEQPDSLTLITASINISCNGLNNGMASVAVSGGTSPYSYLWNTNPMQQNDTIFGLSQGTYKVTVMDANGCEDSVSVNIINPPILYAYAGNNHSVCTGNAVNLGAIPAADGGTMPYSYEWTPATNLNNDTIANPIATPTVNTTYLLEVTDDNGCTATSNVSVNINQPPAVMISQNDTLCVGETTNLAANASGAISYSWNPVLGLNNPNIQTPVASPLITTTYTVTVNFSGNCYNTAQTIVTVNQLPQIITSGNQSICEGDSLVLSASGGLIYSWQPAGLLDNPFSSTPTTVPLNQNTIFTVSVTDNHACSNSSSLTVAVNPIPTPVVTENLGVLSSNYAVGNQWYLNGIIITGAVSQNYTPLQNGDYTVEVTLNNCSAFSAPYTMVGVGILNSQHISDVIIYPMPSNGLINIKFLTKSNNEVIIELQNLLGQVVWVKEFHSEDGIFNSCLDLKGLNDGLYLLHVKNEDNIFIERVIIAK